MRWKVSLGCLEHMPIIGSAESRDLFWKQMINTQKVVRDLLSIRNLDSKHYFTRRSHNFIADMNMFCHGVQEILSYFLGNWRDCWCFHLACNHVTSQKCLCLHHWLWVCVCGGGEGLSFSGSLPVCVSVWGEVDGDCMACSVYYRHNL